MSNSVNLSFETISHRTRAGEAYAIRWYLITRGYAATRVTLSQLYSLDHAELQQFERENGIMLAELAEEDAK